VSVRIFISCVSNEFRTYRDQLRHDLTRHNVEVKVQEDFKDYGVVTLDKLDIYIRACDAVVHLVGDMTGAAAKPASTQAIRAKYPDIAERLPALREPLERGEEISHTQWEAWLALYHGKPLLIAEAAGDAEQRGREADPARAAASRAAQQAHLARLRAEEHYPGCTFANADQLAKYIFSSVIFDLPEKERGGVLSHSAGWVPTLGLVIGMLVLLVTPWVADEWAKTLGVPIAAPLALLLAVGGFALPFMYFRYIMMLGAGDGLAGSRDRRGYDALRENLVTGGAAAHLYARWLTAFLGGVDRFFGDAGIADRTLFPRAFGLKTPAPLWTAPAFDRCLTLALLYPIVVVFIMWAASGDVGPAEEALGLQSSLPGLGRGAAVVAIGLTAFFYWRSRDTSGWMELIWDFFPLPFVFTFAGAVAGAAAGAVAGAVAGAGAGAGAFAGSVVVAGAVAGAFAVAVTGTVAVTGPFLDAGAAVGALAFVVAGAGAFVFTFAVDWLNDVAIRIRRQGLFLLSLFVAMTLGCVLAGHWLSSSLTWPLSGPLLLFLGLLTLLNAPFDWASLGLTRALLRRGLELKSWWPFFLAVADALAAIVIVALLALTMVIGVQTFDALAVHGGKVVLPLMPLLDGIADHPEEPEYWWVYALLLSTMIPSLINLVIGGTALMRAVPGLSPALLHFLPATGGVPAYDRAWIAAVLTLQAALGAILGVAVQALVAWGLLFHAMPAAGLGLLDLARSLAALDLPMRVIAFLTGS
jgi:hypothetical protein